MLPPALNGCPKCKKLPILVTLPTTQNKILLTGHFNGGVLGAGHASGRPGVAPAAELTKELLNLVPIDLNGQLLHGQHLENNVRTGSVQKSPE